MEFDFYQQLDSESSRANFDFISYIVGDNETAFSEIMHIAFHAKAPVSFRAAAVAETVCRSYPHQIVPYINTILSDYFKFNHDGVKRGLLKAIIKVDYSEEQQGQLLDLCLEIIRSNKEKVAAKSYALAILMKISEKYPDIRHEIFLVVQTVNDQGSAGWQAAIREVSKKLCK
jgi:hypothetical protein